MPSLLSLMLLASALLAAAAARTQPNIIWLQSDSMDGRLLDPTSPYYEKVFIDGIKRELIGKGVSFVRHYTTSPQCVPSRTSLMTGRYVHETLTTNNGQGLARSTKTGALDSNCVRSWDAATCTEFARTQNQSYQILDLLAAAGYDLQLFARFDAGAGILDDYPAHVPTGDGFHGGPTLPIVSRGANIPGATKGDPYSSSSQTETNPYASDVKVGADVAAFLTSHDPASPRPFFLWMGLVAPHPPYDTSAYYESHVNASAVDAPVLPDRASMHPYDRQMSILKNCYNVDYTIEQLKFMRGAYWGAVAEAMSIVDTVLKAAQSSGHLNNTVVIYTSDHGEMSMEHRMDFKNSLREGSSRVPLVMTPYGVPAFEGVAGRVVTNFTSHIDILPTLMELAGAAIPAASRGQSLVPFLTAAGPSAPMRNAAFAEYHSNLGSTGSFMIRRGEWKLIAFATTTFTWFNATAYVPQLFNIDLDPLEMVNVAAGNPDVVAELFATLEAEFGGPGAIARIDAQQMAGNYALYKQVWGNVLNATGVQAAFAEAYKNVSGAVIAERVAAWVRESEQLLLRSGLGGAAPLA